MAGAADKVDVFAKGQSRPLCPPLHYFPRAFYHDIGVEIIKFFEAPAAGPFHISTESGFVVREMHGRP